MTQDQALAILKTGANVFLTGEPGSGKTHTINRYVTYLREHEIEPAITASTGIAATHIHGMTIHSWSGIGIKNQLTKSDLDKISSGYITRRVKKTKVLIIDEVSMLSPRVLSMVDAVCRKVKQNSVPFGGIQVVLVGDFFQLPPIIKVELNSNSIVSDTGTMFAEEEPPKFAYDSPAWISANSLVCYLTDQYRQEDDDFLSILSSIRTNTFTNQHLIRVESRKVEREEAPNGPPKLFSHNADVDRVNNSMLAKLPGEPKTFITRSQGPKALVASLKKGCLSPEMLNLKTGAAVMFTKNNPQKHFVNGTVGKIESFSVSRFPIVKIRSGKSIEVEPMDWTIEESGKVLARITQFPLRLAWAITVHKSQGMSLDEAVVDLSGVFEFGQGYVALSRLRRLSGLYLLGWNSRAFEVHPEVLAKDKDFRAASNKTEVKLSQLSASTMSNEQENFIRLIGGKATRNNSPVAEIKIENSVNKTPFKKIRDNYPNAYRPWAEAQDEELRELFKGGLSIVELAKVFGRNRGAIKSRLAKLELIES